MTVDERKRPNVKPGQVWEDNDKRSRGRQVSVTSVTDDRRWVYLRNLRTGKTTCVAYDRMRPTSTGYKLVQDV